MEVIHFVKSIDKSTGGPAVSITTVVQAMINYSGIKSYLYTGFSDYPELNFLLNPNETVKYFELGFLGRFKHLKIRDKVEESVILHGNGIWDMPIHQMCLYARKKNIPYVLTTHGMLEPWALEQAKIKKKFALCLYQYSDLKKAACLHATSKKESSNYSKLGLTNPVAIIPNGIDLSQINPIKIQKKGNKNKLLFLSRIHNGKGLENLLNAWKNLPAELKQNWSLEIVGAGEDNYVKGLVKQIEILNIQDNVKLIGPLYDKKKNNAFQSADLFVLPTFSENCGMVVAEAMAYGLPVITTKGAPWEELQTHNAGWWIDIGVEPLTTALMEAMSTPKTNLIEMGKNGRKLIEDKYSIESVAKQMTELYEWILQKRDKPDFVI